MSDIKPVTFDPSDKRYGQLLEATKHQVHTAKIQAAQAIYQKQIALYEGIQGSEARMTPLASA